MPLSSNSLRAALAGLAVALLLPETPVSAQSADGTVRRDLKRVERELEARRERAQDLHQASERVRLELGKLRRQILAMTKATQSAETALAEVESRLADLDRSADERTEALRQRNRALATSFQSLGRLARRSTVTMLASAGSPVDAYRSMRMMSEVSSGLLVQASRIKVEIAGVVAIRDNIAAERQEQLSRANELNRRRGDLTYLLDEKLRLERQIQAKHVVEQRQVERLSKETRTLRDLVKRLSEVETQRQQSSARAAAERQTARRAERKRMASVQLRGKAPMPAHKPELDAILEPEDSPDSAKTATVKIIKLPARQRFSEARGKLPMPARGRVVTRFGAQNTLGQTSRGIQLETLPQAQVVAPFDGEVMYAGDFRDYGLLLIISLGEGYHILLSGMSRLYSVVGQQVLAGEPVGEMGLIDVERPKLYVELRRQGEPINPLPWISAAKGKISG